MKLVWFISTLAAVASAALAAKPSSEAITDELLFNFTLPKFITRRVTKDPRNLNWTSDGCSRSPDNPFHFPFLNGCRRHDFGYRNYKKQRRFNEDTRKEIDVNFKLDLEYLCESVRGASARKACKALAKVYYAGVRIFGGKDHEEDQIRSKAPDDENLYKLYVEAEEENLYKLYIEAEEEYKELVKEVQASGELPVLNGRCPSNRMAY